MHLRIVQGLGPVLEHDVGEGQIHKGIQSAETDGGALEPPAQGLKPGIIFPGKQEDEIDESQKKGIQIKKPHEQAGEEYLPEKKYLMEGVEEPIQRQAQAQGGQKGELDAVAEPHFF